MSRPSLSSYTSARLDTAGREQWVPLAYDGARRYTDRAAAALAVGNAEEMARCTIRARAILDELRRALDPAAGEIARNLDALYDYWQRRLDDGLRHRDSEAFGEVSRMLADFQATWEEAARLARAERARGGSRG